MGSASDPVFSGWLSGNLKEHHILGCPYCQATFNDSSALQKPWNTLVRTVRAQSSEGMIESMLLDMGQACHQGGPSEYCSIAGGPLLAQRECL